MKTKNQKPLAGSAIYIHRFIYISFYFIWAQIFWMM